MKDISELNSYLYNCYFLIDESIDSGIKIFTSNGFIDYNDCDLFELGEKTLVAFKKNSAPYFDFCYFSNGEKKYIQNILYEDMCKLFDEPEGNEMSFYTFVKSVEIPSTPVLCDEAGLVYRYNRCDFNKYGPKAFYSSPNIYSITKFHTVLSVSGVGMIVYLKTSDRENQNKGSQTINTGATTLSGAIKSIYEWSLVHNPPFNNKELISETALELLSEIKIPENVLQDIIGTQPDMSVVRYLKGESHSLFVDNFSHLNENRETPNSLKDFYKKISRYRFLKNLKENHISGENISQICLDNEIEAIMGELYEICISNEIYDISLENIKNCVNNKIFKGLSIIRATELLEFIESI